MNLNYLIKKCKEHKLNWYTHSKEDTIIFEIFGIVTISLFKEIMVAETYNNEIVFIDKESIEAAEHNFKDNQLILKGKLK